MALPNQQRLSWERPSGLSSPSPSIQSRLLTVQGVGGDELQEQKVAAAQMAVSADPSVRSSAVGAATQMVASADSSVRSSAVGSTPIGSVEGRQSLDDALRGERAWLLEKVNLQVRKLESTMSEELVKATVSMREQFRQQLEMERQDRQVVVAELRREMGQHSSSTRSAGNSGNVRTGDQSREEGVGGVMQKLADAESTVQLQQTSIEILKQNFELLKQTCSKQAADLQASNAGAKMTLEQIQTLRDQLSEQQANLHKLQQDVFDQQSQQNAAVQACKQVSMGAASESEQLSLKMSAAETAIANLRDDMHEHRSVVESVRQEMPMQADVQQDTIQQRAITADLRREVGNMNDQLQDVRQELEAQRMHQMEQSSKFTAATSDTEDLKLKISLTEATVADMRALLKEQVVASQQQSGASHQDLSMQTDLLSKFLGLQETLAQLRGDIAAQASMDKTEVLAKFSGLQELVMQQANTDKTELLNKFLGMQKTISQLRDDVAAEANKNLEFEVQQAGLASLRQEVSKLQLSVTPVTASPDGTRGASLPPMSDSIRSTESDFGGMQDSLLKLRADLDQRITVVKQKVQTDMELLHRKVDQGFASRLDEIEDGIQRSNAVADQLSKVLQLAQFISKGSEQLKERVVSEAVSTRTFMVQTESRLSHLETSVVGGSALASNMPEASLLTGTGPPTGPPSTSGAQSTSDAAQPDSETPTSTSFLSGVPASDKDKEAAEQMPLMSEDLVRTLSSLVTKIQKTVSTTGERQPDGTTDKTPRLKAEVLMESASRSHVAPVRQESVGPDALAAMQRDTRRSCSPTANVRHDPGAGSMTLSVGRGLDAAPGMRPASMDVQSSMRQTSVETSGPRASGGRPSSMEAHSNLRRQLIGQHANVRDSSGRPQALSTEQQAGTRDGRSPIRSGVGTSDTLTESSMGSATAPIKRGPQSQSPKPVSAYPKSNQQIPPGSPPAQIGKGAPSPSPNVASRIVPGSSPSVNISNPRPGYIQPGRQQNPGLVKSSRPL